MWREAALGALAIAAVMLPAGAAAEDDGVISATVRAVGGVAIEVQPPDRPLAAGSPFNIEARITGGQFGLAFVVLHRPAGLLVRGLPFDLVLLRPGKVTTARWSACAPTPGSYLVMASLHAFAVPPVESQAEAFAVGGKKAKQCPKPWYW
jgi:hypothetical protein